MKRIAERFGFQRLHAASPDSAPRWAQVNGLGDEIETPDKLRARVQYDIDTLRNGSLGFDLMIIGKTVAIVWCDQNAY